MNLEEKIFTINRSKNSKTRILYLPKKTWSDLKEIIGEDRLKEENLFGIHLRTLGCMVTEIIKKLRVASNGRGAHAFRHTVIMAMLREGKIEPGVVAQIAGNPAKTIYNNYSGQVSISEQRQAKMRLTG